MYGIDKENKTRSHHSVKEKEQKQSTAIVKITIATKVNVVLFKVFTSIYQHLWTILHISTSIEFRNRRAEIITFCIYYVYVRILRD